MVFSCSVLFYVCKRYISAYIVVSEAAGVYVCLVYSIKLHGGFCVSKGIGWDKNNTQNYERKSIIMVSVIVPVYNSENYIKRCLDSVVNQTFQDIEIILVNDGSTDCSLDILRKYAEDDDRIKVITQENKGVASTRNKGLQNAKGEFILYVDSDDWIEPHMLANMLTLMEEDVDIVFCGHDNALETCNETYSVYRTIEVWDQKKQLSEFMEHKRMTGMLWNKLIRKSITEECKFNEKTGYGEDAEFLWQVLKRSKKMVVTSEILYHHVPQAGSISHLSFSEKNIHLFQCGNESWRM